MPGLLERRAIGFVAQGRIEEAIQAVSQIPLDFEAPSTQYNAACVYALAIASVERQHASDALQSEQNELSDQRGNAAVARLRLAIEYGFSDWDLLQMDSDLDAIRSTAAFQELIEKNMPTNKADR